MGKAVVFGTRIREVTDAELMNSPKALHLRCSKKIKQPGIAIAIDTDVIVEGVSEDLVSHRLLRLAGFGRDTPGELQGSLRSWVRRFYSLESARLLK